MPLQFFNTNQQKLMGGVKILTFGPPGVGKTRLIRTLPTPFMLQAEGGALSLRHENIPGVHIRNIQDFHDAWNWVVGSKESRNFQSFALDSISEIAENCLTFHKSRSNDGRKAYGDTQEQVAIIVKNFRNLQGPHVYFSAKQEFIKVEGASVPLFPGVMMPGNKLAQSIPFDFDEVFQLMRGKTDKGEEFTALRTSGEHEFDIVKDRSGSLAKWEQPDLGAIIRKIIGA